MLWTARYPCDPRHWHARWTGPNFRCGARSMTRRCGVLSAKTADNIPTVLDNIRELPKHYRAVLLDQFGVLHDGRQPYPQAISAVCALAARGLQLLIISNSSRRSHGALSKLKAMGFPEEAFCGAITSGEVAHTFLRDRPTQFWQSLGHRCLHLTWGARGSISLNGLDLQVVDDVEQADFVLAHGTESLGRGDGLEPLPRSLEDIRQLLQAAADRGLPLLIANPDHVTVDGDELCTMPGTFGLWYSEMGGEVHLLGKPAAVIYEAAMQLLGVSDPKQVIAIGDSLEHDIAGAQAAGCDSVFVAGGIHAQQLGVSTQRPFTASEDALIQVCNQQGAHPTFVIPYLRA